MDRKKREKEIFEYVKSECVSPMFWRQGCEGCVKGIIKIIMRRYDLMEKE